MHSNFHLPFLSDPLFFSALSFLIFAFVLSYCSVTQPVRVIQEGGI